MFRPAVPVLAALAVAVAPAAPRLKDAEVVYFPTTVGARWVYRLGTQEEVQVVTKVEEKEDGTRVHVGYVGAGGRVSPARVVLVSRKGLFLLEDGGQPCDPPWCLLKLPAVPGDRWEARTTRPDVGWLSAAHRTGKAEEVAVAAGKFTTVPVTVTDAAREHGKAPAGTTVYSYAPGVGWARITVDGKTVRELQSFAPGKE
jgi:hypothetical protein